jgi:hypothetical protein
MYLAPYLPEKGSLSPSSVRITAARRRDISPHHDPDAAVAGMEVQPPVTMGQPADAMAMEGQAPNATAMEDQPPDAMAGPSLPLAVAAKGQAAVAERLAKRARDYPADLDAMDARGLPVPIAQGLAASVDDVAAPEGSMDGEAPPLVTAVQAIYLDFFYCS